MSPVSVPVSLPGPGVPHVLALDSGIGGLGIAAAIRARAPGARLSYLADHAWFPYGSRPADALTARIVRLVALLAERDPPDLVVVACNTASTAALEALRARFPDLPFVGCVPPVKWAASTSRTRTIGLLATEATVGRDYVRRLREAHAPDCRLVAHGARGLAAAAEARFLGEPLDRVAVRAAVEALFGAEHGDAIDAVCLGCTHYGLLLDALRDASPRPVAWLDPAEAVARRVRALLGDGRAGSAADVRGSPDRAWTTRAPDDPRALERGFRAAGFDGVAPLPFPD